MLPVRMLPSCPVAKRRRTVACFQNLLAASLLVEAGYLQLIGSVAWLPASKMVWDCDNVKKLIDECRERRILWDLCNPDYKDNKTSQNLGGTRFKVRM